MALLRDTIDAVDALVDAQPVRKVLLLDGGRPGWAPDDYDVERQSDGGLGERLANGFAALGPGVIVGMETPHAVSTLQPALDAVARGCDALAPASDGGYWAIGLGRPVATVFEGVEMSTDRTGSEQLARLSALGRRVELLTEARDVDDFEDVRALAATEAWGRAVPLARALVAVHDGLAGG